MCENCAVNFQKGDRVYMRCSPGTVEKTKGNGRHVLVKFMGYRLWCHAEDLDKSKFQKEDA